MQRLDLKLSLRKNKNYLGSGNTVNLEALLLDSGSMLDALPISLWVKTLSKLAPEIPPFSFQKCKAADLKSFEMVPGVTQLPGAFFIGDFRGRPPETFNLIPEEALKRNVPNSGEELLYIAGMEKFPAPAAEDSSEKLQHEFKPFTYSLESQFYSFTGNGHLVSQAVEISEDCWKGNVFHLPLSEALEFFPDLLSEVRLGAEHFRARFWGAYLGQAPKLDYRFYLEAIAGQIYLQLEQADIGPGELPLEKSGLLKAVDQSLEAHNLYRGFIEAARNKL